MENQEQIWDKVAEKWSEFRDRPMEEVVDFLKDKKGNVLDLGCGSGRHLCKLDGKWSCVDFSSRMLNLAMEKSEKEKIKVEIIKSHLSKLPFEDNSFDAAIYISALHCLQKEDRKKSLKELFRVMKKGKSALVSVWSSKQKRIDGKLGEISVPWTVGDKKLQRYYYIYSKDEFEKLLKEVGFKIKKIWESENIFAEVIK